MLSSSATETTINNPVAENAPPNPRGPFTTGLAEPDNKLNMNVGINAIIARKNAPNNVILF